MSKKGKTTTKKTFSENSKEKLTAKEVNDAVNNAVRAATDDELSKAQEDFKKGRPKPTIESSDLPIVPNPKVVTEKYLDEAMKLRDAKFELVLNTFNIELGKRLKQAELMTIGLEETEKNTIKDLRVLQQKFESVQNYSVKLLKTILALSIVFGISTLIFLVTLIVLS